MKNCKLTQHDMYTASAFQMSNNENKRNRENAMSLKIETCAQAHTGTLTGSTQI